MTEHRQAFSFVDLFAGLGGFHVALEGLGGHAVFAAEWDPALNRLYGENFGMEHVWGDVGELTSRDVIAKEIPDHDVLTAGFPCQPFSKAGEQLGFEHTLQGQLFFKVLEILEVKRPAHFILENVPNILRHRGGKTRDLIQKKLEDLDYAVDVRQFSPHQFGVPQIRERAYFVGSQSGLSKFKWPAGLGPRTDVTSVLDRNASPARPIPKQTQDAIDMWDDFLRRSPSNVKLPSFPIWAMEFRATYPFENETPSALWDGGKRGALDQYLGSFGSELKGLSPDKQHALIPSHSRRVNDYQFPKWKKDFIRQNRNFYIANLEWIDPWLARWHPWDLPSSFQKFEWNAQGGARVIDSYVIQVRASGIRVKRTRTAPSLIAMTHTQVPILGKAVAGVRRYMTPAECAKLQSLDEIALPESDLQAYKALGNAVNARVVRAIAEPLLEDLLQPASTVAA